MNPKTTNIIDKLTNHAKNSLIKADKISKASNNKDTNPEHLLYAIFLEKGCVGENILKNIGLKKEFFEKIIFPEKVEETKKEDKKISKKIEKEDSKNNFNILNEEKSEELSLSLSNLKDIVIDAYALASDFSYPYVGTEHFTYVLLDLENENIKKILSNVKNYKRKKRSNLEAFENFDSLTSLNIDNLTFAGEEKLERKQGFLKKFCLNLSAKKLQPFIGREKEIERIIAILGRKDKNNPILIGEAGVGKTALVEYIAQLSSSSKAPINLRGKKIMMLDLALLVAGTSFRGEFEQRLKNIVTEAEYQKNIVLFIDEVHTIVGTGNAGGSLDVANILKPALARGSVQIIGATTFDEYKKHIEKDPALGRRFQKVILKEPNQKETLEILTGLKNSYEKFHNVIIEPEILKTAVDLSVRYIQDNHLPDKAIDLLDETASRLNSQLKESQLQKSILATENELKKTLQNKIEAIQEKRYEEASQFKKDEAMFLKTLIFLQEKLKEEFEQNKQKIQIEDIIKTTALMSHIPYEKISLTPERKLKSALTKLKKVVVGQDEALKSIVQTLNRSITGVASEDRPYGSFLFLGPTGVGKTLTAQTLATEIYGSEENLIRVDMSELMEKHHTSKLLGAPAGYVGYGEGGSLTEKVRRNPYSVVLFDEIEKAHSDVFNILLQILEDGILHDGEGRLINFRHTIIILTSNIGNRFFENKNSTLGFDQDEKKEAEKISENVLNEIKEILSPELLSRLDKKMVFQSLDEKSLVKVVEKELQKLKTRLEKRGFNLVFSKRVIDEIAKKTLNLNEGARGVRKVIYDEVENLVAERIIDNFEKKEIKLELKLGKIVIE